MKKHSELNGAWEERGVIGTRIEIDSPRVTVLWRNAPVLTTTFREVESGDNTELVLKHSGLRYDTSASDYAEIKSLIYEDGKLNMTEFFPISGESVKTLEKTGNSRYGDFTIVDEVLKELRGEWLDDGGTYPLKFSGNTLSFCGSKTKIHILRSNSGYPPDLRIVDENPACYGILDFTSLDYDGETITGRIMVCDAPSVRLVYKKVK